jgi:hypothetical protein
MPASTLRSVREWLAMCHTLRAEVVVLLTLYALYEVARSFVVGDRGVAVEHAHAVASLERTLHVFVEARVQEWAERVPGLLGLLGVAYLTLHLAVTAGVLLWLHGRRAPAYAFVRTTLLVASALALVGFLVFPTAPPRLAGLGIIDTVSGDHVDLNTGLVSALYNPFAAVPSMHIGYAVIVGVVLARFARHALVRAAGVVYAPFVLLVIVATGNHFFLDAAAGAVVVGLGATVARLVARRPRAVARPFAKPPRVVPDELAA